VEHHETHTERINHSDNKVEHVTHTESHYERIDESPNKKHIMSIDQSPDNYGKLTMYSENDNHEFKTPKTLQYEVTLESQYRTTEQKSEI